MAEVLQRCGCREPVVVVVYGGYKYNMRRMNAGSTWCSVGACYAQPRDQVVKRSDWGGVVELGVVVGVNDCGISWWCNIGLSLIHISEPTRPY